MGLTWNRTTQKGFKPKYQQEANPTKDKEKQEHSEGWPHFDRKGNCICLCKRCMGPAGCICKGCAGRGHVGCDKADHWSDGLGNIYPNLLTGNGRHVKVRT